MTDKTLLMQCRGVIEDMRAEHKLHGHITDASARYLIRVKPKLDAALSAPVENDAGGQVDDISMPFSGSMERKV
jgi:hypothetical protein